MGQEHVEVERIVAGSGQAVQPVEQKNDLAAGGQARDGAAHGVGSVLTDDRHVRDRTRDRAAAVEHTAQLPDRL